MSVDFDGSIGRCTSIGTPLARSAGPPLRRRSPRETARRPAAPMPMSATRSSRRRCRTAWRPPRRAAPEAHVASRTGRLDGAGRLEGAPCGQARSGTNEPIWRFRLCRATDAVSIMRTLFKRTSPARRNLHHDEHRLPSRAASAVRVIALASWTVCLVLRSPPGRITTERSTPTRSTARQSVVHWNAGAPVNQRAEAIATRWRSRACWRSCTSIHDAVNAIERALRVATSPAVDDTEASADAAVPPRPRDVLVGLYARSRRSWSSRDSTRRCSTARRRPRTPASPPASRRRATLKRRQGDGANAPRSRPTAPARAPANTSTPPGFDFAAQPGGPSAVLIDAARTIPPRPARAGQRRSTRATWRSEGDRPRRPAERTADQTQIARYWYEYSPLGWNRIASSVARTKPQDLWNAPAPSRC